MRTTIVHLIEIRSPAGELRPVCGAGREDVTWTTVRETVMCPACVRLDRTRAREHAGETKAGCGRAELVDFVLDPAAPAFAVALPRERARDSRVGRDCGNRFVAAIVTTAPVVLSSRRMPVVPIRSLSCAHRGPLIGEFPVRDEAGRLVMKCGICRATVVWTGDAWVTADEREGAPDVRVSAER